MASLSLELCAFRPSEGSLARGPSLFFGMSGTDTPWLGSYSIDWLIWHLKGHLAGVLLCRLAHQAPKGTWLGSYSVDRRIWHLKGHLGGVLLCRPAHLAPKGAPGWGPTLYSVPWAFDGPASLLFSCQCWLVGREGLWWWPHPLCLTQQYLLAPMAARLSSTGISHHNLLPHIP